MKFNEISATCPCCNKPFPVEYMDEDGCKIAYPQNSLGLCPDCYVSLLENVKNNKFISLYY